MRCEGVEAATFQGLRDAMHEGGGYREQVHAHLEGARKRIDSVRLEKARLTAERDQLTARVAELTLRTQIGTPFWVEASKSVGAALERVDARLSELSGILSAAEVDQGSLDLVLDEMSRGYAHLAEATLDEQTRMLRKLVAAVKIEGDEVVLDLYVPQTAGSGASSSGSYKGRAWLPGKHGIRTIRVRVPMRLCRGTQKACDT